MVRMVGLPVEIGGTAVSVGASVGIAVVPGMTPASAVLHRADMAMYTAKNRGKSSFEINSAA
jgi:predicted signal transduction protein with EAL and GGDEF domain